jgi:hypothetical protein
MMNKILYSVQILICLSQDEKSQEKKSKEKSHMKKCHIYNVIFQIIKVFCKNYFNAFIFNYVDVQQFLS